ncbi:PREDICTED: uncharacterized protein LOC106540150 [Thamnophis sirtalis]|uniref:Uncharacterized protein LOC106540150 n=1 Tax=Thamnophis sirtalis TaxID=35019 RepID=A0A6I9X8K1_9SAUR|nr:PREDICTED: uncharacterized protein LOC106540150 [Thamnophis sirtalis]
MIHTFPKELCLHPGQTKNMIESLFSQHGICSASIQRIPYLTHWDKFHEMIDKSTNIYNGIADEKIKTFIVSGDSLTISWVTTIMFFVCPGCKQSSLGKVWIMTAQVDYLLTGIQRKWDRQFFDGAIFFTIHSKQIPGHNEFLKFIKPPWIQEDGFFPLFWEQVFDCSLPSSGLTVVDGNICTGEDKLEDIPGSLFEVQLTGHSYGIYNAVYILAQALHALFLLQSSHGDLMKPKLLHYEDAQPWKRQKVGKVDPDALKGQELVINKEMIIWHRSFNQDSFRFLPWSQLSFLHAPFFHFSQIRHENTGQEIEVGGSATKKLITNLKPQTSYRFSLVGQRSEKGDLQQKVVVSTAANMLSRKPEVSYRHEIDGNVIVTLPDVRTSDPPVQAYYIVVLPLKKTKSGQFQNPYNSPEEMDLEELIQQISRLQRRSLRHSRQLDPHKAYIAARVHVLPSIFTLGDMKRYDNFENKALEAGQKYVIFILAVLQTNEPMYAASPFSDPIQMDSSDPQPKIEGEEGLIWVIGPVLAVVFIICIVIAILLYKNKPDSKRKDSEPRIKCLLNNAEITPHHPKDPVEMRRINFQTPGNQLHATLPLLLDGCMLLIPLHALAKFCSQRHTHV